jgi:predicted nucleic acid-binding protein
LKAPIDSTVRFVLDSFKTHQAIVPALWYTEKAHVIGNTAKRGLIPFEICVHSISRINSLPISKYEANREQSQARIIQLMQELGMSVYDSQYLEIAPHLNLRLATLDIDLRKVAIVI